MCSISCIWCSIVKIISHKCKDRIVVHCNWPRHSWTFFQIFAHCTRGQCFGLSCCSSWNLWIWTDLIMIWTVLIYIHMWFYLNVIGLADFTPQFFREVYSDKKNDACGVIGQAWFNFLIYYITRSFLVWSKKGPWCSRGELENIW